MSQSVSDNYSAMSDAASESGALGSVQHMVASVSTSVHDQETDSVLCSTVLCSTDTLSRNVKMLMASTAL